MGKLDPTDPRVTLEEAVEAHREVGRMFDEATGRKLAEALDVQDRAQDIVLSIIKALPRMLLYQEISEERDRQDAQWGGPAHDDEHEPGDWADLIGTHASGLVNTRIWLGEPHRSPVDDYRDQLVKIAALAVAAIEAYDRKVRK